MKQATGKMSLLALVLLSTILSLVTAEVLFRFYDIGWAALSYEKTRGVVRLAHAGATRRGQHPGIRYELKPNLDQSFKLSLLQTNSEGLHDREYPLAKPEGAYRVAVLGDSQTMASGVTRDESFHARIESRIDPKQFGYDAIEFINFAVGGYSPGDYRDVLEHKAMAYSPDLVVLGFTPRNDEVFNWSEKPVPFREKPQEDGFFRSFFLQSFKELWGRYTGTLWARYTGTPGHYGRGNFSQTHANTLLHLFSDMKRRADEAEIPFVVVYLTRTEQENREPIQAMMESLGVVFIDTSPSFEEIPIEEYRIYRTDHHPNPSAHRIIADAVQPTLEKIIAKSSAPR